MTHRNSPRWSTSIRGKSIRSNRGSGRDRVTFFGITQTFLRWKAKSRDCCRTSVSVRYPTYAVSMKLFTNRLRWRIKLRTPQLRRRPPTRQRPEIRGAGTLVPFDAICEYMNKIRSEVAMKRIFFALCLTWLGNAAAMAQGAQNNRQPQRPPAQIESLASKPQEKAPKPQEKPADSSAAAPEDFLIGPEEVLEIDVWRETDLKTTAVVSPDGKLDMQLLGDVQASGLTADQLKVSVARGLTRFVAEPEVSVVVAEIRSRLVHIIGAVGRQGAYPLGGPLTVMELLARAGGPSETAKTEQISIVRDRKSVV